jgi:hypothetical protein
MVSGGGGAGEGCKGGESGASSDRRGRARELVLRGRIIAFLLRIIS